MTRGWAILLASGLVAGCSGNGPFGGGALDGIFGGPEHRRIAEPVEPTRTYAGLVAAPDGSMQLPAVQSAEADRSRQGVILRVEGLAPTQGFWGGRLVSAATRPDGVETVQFRAAPPLEPKPVGAARTRILAVGRFYSNAEMRDIRGFRVIAGQNALSVAVPPPLPAPPPAPPPDL